MSTFDLYTLLIFATAGVGVVWAVRYNGDTLHPLIFLMPASAFIYGLTPVTSDPDLLLSYFTSSELSFVQGLNLAGITALMLGCMWGSRGVQRDSRRVDLHTYLTTPAWRARIRKMALLLGAVAVGLYAFGLSNVGGFVEAYDSVKGGGRASSGYLRDFTLLAIPAILLLFLNRRSYRSITFWASIALFNFPLLIHGLLSARRGPTFMGLATLAVGGYLSRNRRPSAISVILGGAGVGLLLLVLVTFRSEIYLGSSFLQVGEGPSLGEVVTRTIEQRSEADAGNEFVYGSYVVLQAREENDHYWGTRYLTYAFIRPIPGFLWPTKYQDVGMESLFVNAGTMGSSADPDSESTYTDAPDGAAPGFIGDLYVEFSWGAVVAAFFLGWLFGFFWRHALVRGGIWYVVHVCALVLSLYFVAQTFEAILFRFLVITIPTALLWYLFATYYAPYARPGTSVTDLRTL